MLKSNRRRMGVGSPRQLEPHRAHLAAAAVQLQFIPETVAQAFAPHDTARDETGGHKMITKVSYCSWEGNPAILAYYDDGRMLGFEYQEGTWKDAHPADVSTKAASIGKEAFLKQFPLVVLPAFPK
jgi:hypothetical protein